MLLGKQKIGRVNKCTTETPSTGNHLNVVITDQENHLIYLTSDSVKDWTYFWYSLPGVHVLYSNELVFTNSSVPFCC